MPITLKPYGDLEARTVTPLQGAGYAKNSHDILTWQSKMGQIPRADVLQSSYGKEDFTESLIPTTNGLVDSVVRAWSSHHHLVIRPDDIWFAILSQLNAYINCHGEELRDLFVSHDGKKELVIEYDGGGRLHRYNFNFARFANDMRHKLGENIKDPSLVQWITPTFTTTTDTDVAVASITMMAMMQSYFTYKWKTGCGFPSVTLLGEKADYEDILHRLERMKEFGEEPTLFADLLRPILRRFIRSFMEPEHEDVAAFWCRAVSQDKESGRNDVSGWITAFCFWNAQGKLLYRRPAGDVSQIDESSSGRDNGKLPRKKSFRLDLDGQSYTIMDFQDIPFSSVSVPVKLEDAFGESDARMVAGSVAIRCLEGPQGDGQAGVDTMQPSIGWWIFQYAPKAV